MTDKAELKGCEPQACCACQTVKLDPIQNDNGTCSDRWICTTSGCEFIRVKYAKYLEDKARREGIEEAAQLCEKMARLQRLANCRWVADEIRKLIGGE